jgi:clan AA aspartic protease
MLFNDVKEKTMGNVYAEITLKNVRDEAYAQCGHIKEEEIRTATVRAMVDTGAMTLVISEELCQQLGLEIHNLREVAMANDQTEVAKVTEPVELNWKDRDYIGSAWVIPDLSEPLMGLLPLEYMDLMVDPVNQTLVGVHGDKPVGMVK